MADAARKVAGWDFGESPSNPPPVRRTDESAWCTDRIIPCHGDVIETGGKKGASLLPNFAASASLLCAQVQVLSATWGNSLDRHVCVVPRGQLRRHWVRKVACRGEARGPTVSLPPVSPPSSLTSLVVAVRGGPRNVHSLSEQRERPSARGGSKEGRAPNSAGGAQGLGAVGRGRDGGSSQLGASRESRSSCSCSPLSLSLLARCLSSCVRYSLVVRFIPACDQLPSALALTSCSPAAAAPALLSLLRLTFVLPHPHPRHAQLLRRPRPHFQLRYVGSSSSLSHSRGPTRSSPRRGCALRSLEVAHPDSR